MTRSVPLNGSIVFALATAGGVGFGGRKLYKEVVKKRETGQQIDKRAVAFHTFVGAGGGAAAGLAGQIRYGAAAEGHQPLHTFDRLENLGRRLVGKAPKLGPSIEGSSAGPPPVVRGSALDFRDAAAPDAAPGQAVPQESAPAPPPVWPA